MIHQIRSPRNPFQAPFVGFAINTTIDFRCIDGMTLVEAKLGTFITCLDVSMWSRNAPLCILKSKLVNNSLITCPAPNWSSKALTTEEIFKENYMIGEKINFTCLGSKDSGREIECLENGKWSKLDKCKTGSKKGDLYCRRPERPSNGMFASLQRDSTKYVDGIVKYKAGSRVVFDCETGYELMGAKFSICSPNGKWSAPVPTCHISSPALLEEGSKLNFQSDDEEEQYFFGSSEPIKSLLKDVPQYMGPQSPLLALAEERVGSYNIHLQCESPEIEKFIQIYSKGNILGDSALHVAVLQNQTHLVECLIIREPFSVGNRAQFGRTPLHYASDLGFSAIVDKLLNYGSITEWRDDNGVTALHIAAAFGRLETAHVLLENGANPNALTFAGQTSLQLAVESDAVEMAHLLLEFGADTETTSLGRSNLHLAVEKGSKKMVKMLLDYSANPMARNRLSSQTTLHSAVTMGHIDIAKGIIEALLNSRRKNGDCALHSAVMARNENSIDVLIRHGSDIDCKGFMGRTPLHLAASNGFSDMIIVLLHRGARINEKDLTNGATPLHLAATFGQGSAVSLLVREGAAVRIHDRLGQTAREGALRMGRRDIANYLASVGG